MASYRLDLLQRPVRAHTEEIAACLAAALDRAGGSHRSK